MLPADWFVVLPRDSAAARRCVERARVLDPYTRILAHHDGQPWIIGQSRAAVTRACRAGTTAVLIGTHTVTERELAAVLPVASGRVSVLMRFPGSYHALFAAGEERQVCGDVTGLRAVFTTRVPNGMMAGSHARVLAQVVDAGPRPDPAHLARLLLGPVPPLALTEDGTTPYEGIGAVPPGSSVRLRDGRIVMRSWWEVPDDEAPLADAAPVLREALRVAVGIRLGHQTIMGYEAPARATGRAMAALVREHDRRIHLIAARGAEAALATRPGFPAEGAGPVMADPSGLEAAPFLLDGPTPALLSAVQSRYRWGRTVSAGAETLLSDGAAREGTSAPLSYLLRARRRSRIVARRHVAGWASLGGVPRSSIHAHAGTRGSYGAWLADCLAADRRGGWEAGSYAPPWLTPLARDVLGDALARAASGASPVHRMPHQHGAVAALRGAARTLRARADAAALYGVRMEYPYADRAVVEAALSTRAEERLTPFRSDPLLTTAMADVEPAPEAPDIGYTVPDVCEPRDEHVGRIRRLVTGESALASMGLVDADRLSDCLGAPQPIGELSGLLLSTTLMCELWVRSLYPRAER
ncbi:asparagine synthase-related protein [Streptomyces sp. NPDC059917]|uniref:asparagine synthase-related protein n=1 Tax=Streptomyces sp. NPDC059917 TaxID=3347002 RepID=UPI003668D3EC